MQKIFTQKGFVLMTLLFVGIAAFSFAAFTTTDDLCTAAKEACKAVQPAKPSELLWEVVSRQFLSLVRL